MSTYTPRNLKNGDIEWQAEAACRGMNPDIFFWGGAKMTDDRTQANQTCARCPVRRECLDFAMDNNIHDGTWGGVNEMDRARMRRQRQKRAREMADG